MSMMYPSIEEFVRINHGDSKRIIKRVLMANNGIAAVKGIRSLKRWSYETFGNENMITFIAMATPEDLKSNAEYIHLADEFIEVPGGTNNNNYANIKLIADIAVMKSADAVWPGWGHASENPLLPEMLMHHNVIWLGPPPNAMRALGDKIASTIIAQNADVSCMPWSGSDVIIDYKKDSISDKTFRKACATTSKEAEKMAEKIGYPIMIKASEGGGGKGIRAVHSIDDVSLAFSQVQTEVPGSPIFLMKLAPKTRHLEVQLVADHHGQAIALFGRDCSVQRRHQKIIEEGPVVAAPPEQCREMEQAAVRLAKEVNYASLGTVEYLYMPDNSYCFLELNPRLQVEHTVTELITGVNLPAIQLQIGMGLPLHCIRDIRELYKVDLSTKSPIDFDNINAEPLPRHVIACRITAENPIANFQPTSGQIKELNFRSSPQVFGYFSVGSNGGIHEYADSQFGHIFATGTTRDVARQNMIMALHELSIRGEISTTIEYLPKIMSTDDYIKNNIDTKWLERMNDDSSVQIEKPNFAKVVVLGAMYTAYESTTAASESFIDILKRGQMPSREIFNKLIDCRPVLIYENTKYFFRVTRSGESSFDVLPEGCNNVIRCIFYPYAGGLLVSMGGEKFEIHGHSDPRGLRLLVNGKTVNFTTEYDPTRLRAPLAGKLTRLLVKSRTNIKKDQAYAEMEVMKMIITLKSPEAGLILPIRPEGSILDTGDTIARLELEDESTVKKAEVFTGSFPSLNAQENESKRCDLIVKEALEHIFLVLKGYSFADDVITRSITMLMQGLRNPLLPLLQFRNLISSLIGRVSKTMLQEFDVILDKYENDVGTPKFEFENIVHFPCDNLLARIESQRMKFTDERELNNFDLIMTDITNLLYQFQGGNHMHSVHVITSILDTFYDVENHFNRVDIDATAIKLLRTDGKDIEELVDYVRAHFALSLRIQLLQKIGKVLESQFLPVLDHFQPSLTRLASLLSNEYAAVALMARKLLNQTKLPTQASRLKAVNIVLDAIEISHDKVERNAWIKRLVDDSSDISDLLFDGLKNIKTLRAQAALEVYVNRTFVWYKIFNFKINYNSTHNLLHAVWNFSTSDSTGEISSYEKISQARLYSSSTYQLVNKSKSTDSILALARNKTDIERVGQMFYADDFSHIEKKFEHIVDQVSSSNKVQNLKRFSNVIYIIFRWSGQKSDDDLSKRFHSFVEKNSSLLEQHQIKRITFVIPNDNQPACFFTFQNIDSQAGQYVENRVIRHLEPAYALHLELSRLKNFDLKLLNSSNRLVRLFAASIKENKSESGNSSLLFARTIIRIHQAILIKDKHGHWEAHPEIENSFVSTLNAMEVAVGGSANRFTKNSIFLNLIVPPTSNPQIISDVIRNLGKRYADKIRRLRIAMVEILVPLYFENNQSEPIRFVCTNPTGWNLQIDVYKHVFEKDCNRLVFECFKSDIIAPWHGLEVHSPYPVSHEFDNRRHLAANLGTTWIYDFVPMFDKVLRRIWRRYCKANNNKKIVPPRIARDDSSKFADYEFLKVTELVLEEKNINAFRDQDKYVLKQLQRQPGLNTFGMVAWLFNLRTPEYPDGREIIIIGNDITYMAGSFGPKEYILFDLACKLALKKQIPMIYLAANSGARIGLAKEIVNSFKISWHGSDPTNGLNYLYLSSKDYEKFKTSVKCHEITIDKDEKRYIIDDIIGLQHGLNVENLALSGLIAGDTSRAYDEIVTMSIVTGRTVGIGAYLVRLAQRVIQRTSQPILLTGYGALNKLLSQEVYSSNLQIGGPQIMHTNGVTHLISDTDVKAVENLLNWLSFIPKKRNVLLPGISSPIQLKDPIERKVALYNLSNDTFDSRYLINGWYDNDNQFHPGLFDNGSFMELMSGWARSVICGRARLGGIPCGVIAVETRNVSDTIPADPAVPESTEQNIIRAGQVWYPDSAYKTAQAIWDMRNEDVPLFILANWRGFSGGMQDMLNEVLKFGSYIVDALRVLKQPVFVYLPPYATLRGGAWVVLDSTINENFMEMYADCNARAGILEPEGTVGVKFKAKVMRQTIHRLDPKIIQLQKQLSEEKNEVSVAKLKAAIGQREQDLMHLYHPAATALADLHDTPGRLVAKGNIRAIVAWESSREYFYWRLRRRMFETNFIKNALNKSTHDIHTQWKQVESQLNELIYKKLADNSKNDELVVKFYEKNPDVGKSLVSTNALLKFQDILDAVKHLNQKEKSIIMKQLSRK